MKLIIILFVNWFLLIGYGQTRSDFYMNYKTYGLGSNTGDSSLIFTIQNGVLQMETMNQFAISEIGSSTDTINHQYYRYGDSVFIINNYSIPLRLSTIDSIEMYLKSSARSRINTNFCVKSGSVHCIDIQSDSVEPQSFRLYNTFDSTALQITDLLFQYFPAKTVDFRPLKLWKLDIECEKLWKIETPSSENKAIPAYRRELIEKTIQEELHKTEQ